MNTTIRKCNHAGANGVICKSSALKNSELCFYHNRNRQRGLVFKQARQLKLSKDFADYPEKQEQLNPEILEALELPSFDDPAAIQVALSNIAHAIMSGHIATKRAGLVLYALQIAAMNIKNTRIAPFQSDQVADEDAHPIAPLYPENCAYFPVPNHASGEKAPQRTADSTLGNLPRNDFPSMGLKPDPTDPKVIAANLAKANPEKANPENANPEKQAAANSAPANHIDATASARLTEKKSNGKARDYFPYAGGKEVNANPSDR